MESRQRLSHKDPQCNGYYGTSLTHRIQGDKTEWKLDVTGHLFPLFVSISWSVASCFNSLHLLFKCSRVVIFQIYPFGSVSAA